MAHPRLRPSIEEPTKSMTALLEIFEEVQTDCQGCAICCAPWLINYKLFLTSCARPPIDVGHESAPKNVARDLTNAYAFSASACG